MSQENTKMSKDFTVHYRYTRESEAYRGRKGRAVALTDDNCSTTKKMCRAENRAKVLKHQSVRAKDLSLRTAP